MEELKNLSAGVEGLKIDGSEEEMKVLEEGAEEHLEWRTVKADNLLIRNLEKLTMLMGVAIKKETANLKKQFEGNHF